MNPILTFVGAVFMLVGAAMCGITVPKPACLVATTGGTRTQHLSSASKNALRIFGGVIATCGILLFVS